MKTAPFLQKTLLVGITFLISSCSLGVTGIGLPYKQKTHVGCITRAGIPLALDIAAAAFLLSKADTTTNEMGEDVPNGYAVGGVLVAISAGYGIISNIVCPALVNVRRTKERKAAAELATPEGRVRRFLTPIGPSIVRCFHPSAQRPGNARAVDVSETRNGFTGRLYVSFRSALSLFPNKGSGYTLRANFEIDMKKKLLILTNVSDNARTSPNSSCMFLSGVPLDDPNIGGVAGQLQFLYESGQTATDAVKQMRRDSK